MKTLPWLCVFAVSAAGVRAEENVDLAAVHRIRTEAFDNGRVMEHLFYLTDVHGPRLTNSPGFRQAADWAVKRLGELGVERARLEKWGPYGRGWSYSRYSAHLLEPGYQPLAGFPMAWSPGTNGVLTAEPVLAPMRAEADLERYKGKLRGKIVLIDLPRDTPVMLRPAGRRLGPPDLQDLFGADVPGRREQESPVRRPAAEPAGVPKPIGPVAEPQPPPADSERRRRFMGRRNEFLKKEGAVAMISTGYAGDGGTVFATAAGDRDAKFADPPPAIAITPEHYNRIVRLLEKKIAVKVEMEVRAQFHTESLDSFNVTAEIAGGAKREEIVMIGAHFDSWHGGTGATDNGAGSAVMIEAMRILKALDLKTHRTIRLALWGGEENGLLGSRAYVKEHFADPEVMKPTTQHQRLAAYFNYDNGTGKIRGVYLQGNDMVRPIFEAWLKPFHDLGANALSIRKTGGTDHLSFDAVGLPGFQFIQDPVEYQSRTHHSNMDTYDHVEDTDLRQASAIVASFAYHAATRAEMLPRKPLPKPKPRTQGESKDRETGN
jgi:hypothetical protein